MLRDLVIPLPPNTPHQTMRDSLPNNTIIITRKLSLPTNQVNHSPKHHQMDSKHEPLTTTQQQQDNEVTDGLLIPHYLYTNNTSPKSKQSFFVNYQSSIYSPKLQSRQRKRLQTGPLAFKILNTLPREGVITNTGQNQVISTNLKTASLSGLPTHPILPTYQFRIFLQLSQIQSFLIIFKCFGFIFPNSKLVFYWHFIRSFFFFFNVLNKAFYQKKQKLDKDQPISDYKTIHQTRNIQMGRGPNLLQRKAKNIGCERLNLTLF